MEKTKLTLRIERPVIEQAKQYAGQHNTTLSKLVSEFLHTLNVQSGSHTRTPILEELTSILPADVSQDDYHAYLEAKYGR